MQHLPSLDGPSLTLKEALKQAMPEDGSFHRNHAALSRQSWPVEAYAKHWVSVRSVTWLGPAGFHDDNVVDRHRQQAVQH